MSLILIREPEQTSPQNAKQLSQGTWFIDHYGQIYVIVHDDQSGQKRIVCLGDYCHPFIPNISSQHIEVDHILPKGTLLQITSIVPLLEGR